MWLGWFIVVGVVCGGRYAFIRKMQPFSARRSWVRYPEMAGLLCLALLRTAVLCLYVTDGDIAVWLSGATLMSLLAAAGLLLAAFMRNVHQQTRRQQEIDQLPPEPTDTDLEATTQLTNLEKMSVSDQTVWIDSHMRTHRRSEALISRPTQQVANPLNVMRPWTTNPFSDQVTPNQKRSSRRVSVVSGRRAVPRYYLSRRARGRAREGPCTWQELATRILSDNMVFQDVFIQRVGDNGDPQPLQEALSASLHAAIPRILQRIHEHKQGGGSRVEGQQSNTISAPTFARLMKATGPDVYTTDSRAMLGLFHRINSSGSGAITSSELAQAATKIQESDFQRWLLELSIQ